MTTKNGLTYAAAGVDIDAGNALVERIKPAAKRTARAGTMAGLGGFGALFDLKGAGYTDPVLVAATDGVGTKLRIAIDTGNVDTIGIDLVAMCVNDVLAQGAEPLFFLDYFATGKLEEGVAAEVVKGVAEGCLQAGCALIGGETAEMPGMYPVGEYDLAGFCVGAVERRDLMPREVKAGDVLIAVPSSGPHSNGYSLIRKIVADAGLSYDAAAPFDPDATLGAALLTPTRIYVKALLDLLKDEDVRGFAHITGGGLTDNVPRIFTDRLCARYDDAALRLPPVFAWLKDAGGLSQEEMRRTFNCGVGGVLAVRKSGVNRILDALESKGETPRIIGDVVEA